MGEFSQRTSHSVPVPRHIKGSNCVDGIVRVVKSRRLRWAGYVSHMGAGRGVHRVLVGKPKGKKPMGRPKRRWEDNIKMDIQEVGGGCGHWDGVGSG